MNTIITEIQGKVGIIRLNRPEAMNCVNEKMAEEFALAMGEMEHNDDINIIILTGMGKAFCAGGDIKAMQEFATAAEAMNYVQKVGNITHLIYHCRKPVIAMVNGAAAGAGFNIALACDLIIAAANCKFIQSFVNVGLAPDCGGHYLLPKAVGSHLAKQFMFEAAPVTAEQGKELGFVNKIFPTDTLEQETLQYAKMLSEKAPLAMQVCKNILNNSEGMTLEDMLEVEAKSQSLLAMTDDCKEGLAAFTEKRQPIFRGE